MQVTLFKALKSISIDDDRATAVVGQLEEHVEVMVRDANKVLEAKLDAMRLNLEAMQQSQARQTAFLGAMIAIVGIAIAAGPFAAKLIH